MHLDVTAPQLLTELSQHPDPLKCEQVTVIPTHSCEPLPLPCGPQPDDDGVLHHTVNQRPPLFLYIGSPHRGSEKSNTWSNMWIQPFDRLEERSLI